MHDVFFFTDIHGHRALFDAIMNYCHEQDPEAMIIFGGDAIDRGSDGYQIMKELLDNPKVCYLKGNHEDMFCKAAREIKEEVVFDNMNRECVRQTIHWCRGYDYRYSNIQLTLVNGGLETLTDWVMDGMPMDLVDRVNHLPLTFNYGNCDFCHSACAYKSFERVANAEYEDAVPDSYAAESLIWGRTGLNFDWAPNHIAVFGHTPTPYLEDYIDFKYSENNAIPVLYNEGRKLDMDTGAIFTNRAYVLNVLTMQAQGFEIENDSLKKIECIQF